MEYIPPCKKNRTFFDLFKIYDCKECKYYDSDEHYNIGELSLNIYYIERCVLNNNDFDIIENLKLKILLKDAILYHNKCLIVWLEDFNCVVDEDLIYDLLSFDMDVQIIV